MAWGPDLSYFRPLESRKPNKEKKKPIAILTFLYRYSILYNETTIAERI